MPLGYGGLTRLLLLASCLDTAEVKLAHFESGVYVSHM